MNNLHFDWEELDYLLDSTYDDDYNIVADYNIERRQYKMCKRINMDKWDDDDFFIVLKPTFAKVLLLNGPQQQRDIGRYESHDFCNKRPYCTIR